MADRASAPRILLDEPITFEAGEQQIHTPMVRAVAGGIATKLILDTGSSDHVFTRELADEASLPVREAEPGTDSTGAAVPSWSLGELTVEIGGRSFPLHDVVAIPGPPPFVGWGVGGFLSPQHLHPEAWLVLDLDSERLVLVDGESGDVAEWLADRWPGFHLTELERLASDPTILVRAAIDPFEPVVVLLDTGGKSTVFAAKAVPGLAGEHSGAGRGLSGTRIVGEMVDDQTLVVADMRLPVPRLVVSEAVDGQDGLVGIDVLRGTILVVRANRTKPVYWLVRAEPSGTR